MREKLESGMGVTEEYVDGDHLIYLLRYGIMDVGYINSFDEPMEQFGTPDWDILFESNRFKKVAWQDYTLYYVEDENGDPLLGLVQYV